MRRPLTILFVQQFYRLNTGFFLVCFFILFGILNFGDMLRFHHAIMQQANTTYVLLILVSVWLLYAIKCFGFGQRVLLSPSNSFLIQLQGSSDSSLLRIFSGLQIQTYLPALAYAVITAGVQTAKGNIVTASIIVFVQAALIFLPAYVHTATINSSYKQRRLEKLAELLSFGDTKKKFRFWLLHYLFHQRKAAVLSIKIGSLILLQALVTYNANRMNFESVCYLVLGLVAAHAILPYYLREFIEERLRFVRAMPLTLPQPYTWFLFSYAVLMLPELLFLLLHVKSALPVSMLLLIYVVAVVQLTLYSSLLYLPNMNVEKYMLVAAVLFFASILFLAAFPLWQFALAILVVSFALFAIFYERWEATIN